MLYICCVFIEELQPSDRKNEYLAGAKTFCGSRSCVDKKCEESGNSDQISDDAASLRENPASRFFSASPDIFEFGIEEHSFGEKKIKVYPVARTIADSFKYRNRTGLNIAIAALGHVNTRLKNYALQDKVRFEHVLLRYAAERFLFRLGRSFLSKHCHFHA